MFPSYDNVVRLGVLYINGCVKYNTFARTIDLKPNDDDDDDDDEDDADDGDVDDVLENDVVISTTEGIYRHHEILFMNRLKAHQ